VVRALNEKALLKYDQDSLDEARELIDAAIRFSETGSAYLLNNRGLISWKMGRTDQAKSDFLESIELDSANGDPYFNIGLIYFDESNYLKALQYLRRAVEINPFDSQFLTELGHLYLELEREEEALLLFEKAFKNNPGDPQVDFHLGYYFLYKKHDPNNAISYYEKGLRKDPDDQFALADLAIAYWVLGNQSKSSEIHQILKSKSRLMPYTISRMVYLNVEMGDYDTALNYYKKALTEGEPFEPEWLHYNAALVYAKTGRPKLALDILDLAVKAGGDAVIKRAISDKALSSLKRSADFKKLIKQSERK
jgi:tetratricopeptide (TPR) repeat protein